MGGILELESEEGGGSNFRIIFKNLKYKNQEILESVSAEVDPNEYNDIEFEPSKILIVDDVRLNRELIIKYLEKYKSLKTIQAENGKEGVDLALLEKPDFIFMDIKMPVMDGIEAISKIKEIDSISKIPIVAVTASVFEFSKIKIESICEGFLRKPVSKRQIIEVLCKFIKHSHSESEKSSKFKDNSVKILDMDKIKNLYEIINRDYLSRWKNLKEVIDISECIQFASEINSIATQFQYEPLREWALNFDTQSRSFNINSINQLLSKFEKLLVELRLEK
jgi:CheY-like chemotaxis protein